MPLCVGVCVYIEAFIQTRMRRDQTKTNKRCNNLYSLFLPRDVTIRLSLALSCVTVFLAGPSYRHNCIVNNSVDLH